MSDRLFEHLSLLRATVGYLGEREQLAWWQSSFFSPQSPAFLAPVFGRTQVLAQCVGVARAAAALHDAHIGVGRVHHLFRLPEELERALHRTLCDPATAQQITAFYVLTRGGPADATRILPIEVYLRAFQLLEMGRAAAISMVMFVFLMVLTVIQLKFFKVGDL